MTRSNNTHTVTRSISLTLLFAWIACLMPNPVLAGTTPLDSANPGVTTAEIFGDHSGERVDLPVPPPILPGWPRTMGVHPTYAPMGVLLADLDSDGDQEVLAGSTDNNFYVWDHLGVLLPEWPVNVGGQVQSKAAAADLDGDGDLEIIIAVKSGVMRILHHDGSPLNGWPQTSGLAFGLLSPSVYDLDADGSPEVMVGGGGNVRVWNGDGTPRSGWPQTVAGTISGTLAIGDVTGDQGPEIMVVSTSRYLYCFNADGTQPPGWPVLFDLSTSYAAPSIGDLDGDGDNEVCLVGYEFGVSTTINAFNGDGTPVSGFPVTYPSDQTYSCPVLGDADGDGDLELFNAGKVDGDAFYAWDHQGVLLPGWPTTGASNMEGSAIVANFDGLPGMEIAVADNSGPGLILGYNLDGGVATDFPIPKPGIGGFNSPEVGDVDGDGDLDMALTTWDGSVTVWDFAVDYDENEIEWGALFHDDWNTNQHGFVVPPADLTSVAGTPWIGPATLGAAYPNPVERRSTTIPFALSREADLRLGVYDITGRRVRLLHQGNLDVGAYRITWDGRDQAGLPSAAGVYFINLETPGVERQSTKITLIR